MRSFVNWVHSLAYVVRGAHCMRMGDDDGVIRNYTRAIEISPEDLDYYYARGHAHWHKRELGDAIADFSKAIELDPDDLYSHLVRGAIYREKGFLTQAIADLNFVLNVDDLAIAFYLRAACHSENKDYEMALADLEEVLAREPHHAKALELKAWCEKQIAGPAAEK
jgi:tetratricopeptide (TPR) repeat protein